MRISDWSSDVCSSDLILHPPSALIITRQLFDTPAERHAHMTGRKRCAAEAHGHFSGGGWVLQRQVDRRRLGKRGRSEEHTSELQSLMRISYAVFCLKKKNKQISY